MATVTVADILGDKIRKALAGALSDAGPELDKIAKDAGNTAAHGIVGDIGTVTGILTDIALVGLLAEPGVGEAVAALKVAEGEAGKIGIGGALGYMLGYTMFSMLNPLFMPIQHAVAHELTNQIHDADTAAQLVSRGLMTYNHGADEASGSAFDGDHFARLVALSLEHPSVTQLLELWRRGHVDEDYVAVTMQRQGYSEQSIGELVKLRRQLLSPADFALAFLRTEIDEQEMQARGTEAGVTPDDMAMLVANTGEPLGLESLLFAYRRGFIDEPRLERGIRQSRVRNEWIPTAKALRFAPMSTADAVRAVVEHYITEAEGGKIAAENGLEPQHWDTIVKSWGRPLAHMEMASLVHRGKASRAQFDQAMHESDLKNKYTNLSFEIATPLLPERLIVQAIQHQALSTKEGAKILLQRGYTQESASILLKLGLHEQTTTQHGLTRSQITTLYAEGGLTREQALHNLEAMGYNAQTAGLELEIVDLHTRAAELKAEIAAVRTQFLSSGIDANHAEAELAALGLTPVQVRQNMLNWDREKRRVSKTLSEPQIVKAAGAGVLTVEDALTLLGGLGYSRANAVVLLQTEGVPISG